MPLDPQEVIAAYERHRNVWKAGAELGIAGQTVHKILKQFGVARRNPHLTEGDKRRIADYYENTPAENFDLSVLAAELGRTRQFIARHARKLGLTNSGRKHNAKTLARLRETYKDRWVKHPHPRGMAGKKHTPEVRAIVSLASRKSWATMKAFGIGNMSPANRAKLSARMAKMAAERPAEKNYSRTRAGRREDLGGIYFRSGWEANYARYLNMLIRLGVVEKWDFEPETFWFDGVRRGTNSYKPDFRVHYRGDPTPEYIEIKGWIVPKDRTKWRRMAKYHPTIKLVVVKAKEYYAIERKWASSIPEWEKQRRTPRRNSA